jgi:hypothetical protein
MFQHVMNSRERTLAYYRDKHPNAAEAVQDSPAKAKPSAVRRNAARVAA